jgi:hypothetical protein
MSSVWAFLPYSASLDSANVNLGLCQLDRWKQYRIVLIWAYILLSYVFFSINWFLCFLLFLLSSFSDFYLWICINLPYWTARSSILSKLLLFFLGLLFTFWLYLSWVIKKSLGSVEWINHLFYWLQGFIP